MRKDHDVHWASGTQMVGQKSLGFASWLDRISFISFTIVQNATESTQLKNVLLLT